MRRWRLVLLCTGMFLAGLLPYAYLPLRAAAKPPINWGDPSTFERFVAQVTRRQYGAVGPMKTVEPRSLKRLARQAGYVAESVADDLTIWVSVLTCGGVMLLIRRDRRVLLLVIMWVAGTGLLFAMLANFDFDRTSWWAMRVSLIPASLGLAVPIAVLLDETTVWVARRATSVITSTAIVGAIACAVLAAPLVTHWKDCNYSNYWFAEDHARNLLACMMPNALVFPPGDHAAFPLVYMLMVEHVRDDVLLADIDGYVRSELLDGRPEGSPEPPDAWLIRRAHRPAYFTTKEAPPVENANFVPAGLLYHLLPTDKQFDSRDLLDQCRYRNWKTPTTVDYGASMIMADYEFFAGLQDLNGGETASARTHFSTSAKYGWGIKELFNNIGSALAEHHLEGDAKPYFEEAARLDPRYMSPRRNLVRPASVRGDWHEARSTLENILQIEPDDCRASNELGFLLRDRFADGPAAADCWRRSLRVRSDQPQIARALAE